MMGTQDSTTREFALSVVGDKVTGVRLADGSEVGYKVVKRGWALRTPLLETISRMDMRLFMVEVSVSRAFTTTGTSSCWARLSADVASSASG